MNRIPTCTLLALATTMALAMTACSRPEPPDTERPPEPQAEPADAGTQAAAPAASLDDSLHAPIDRAKAVEDTLQDAAQRQRDAIDAAGG